MTNTSAATKRPAGNRWRHLAWIAPVVVVLAIGAVFLARWLRTLPEVQAWMGEYPGSYESPVPHPEGIPAWLGWQHFFNLFLLVLIRDRGRRVRAVIARVRA